MLGTNIGAWIDLVDSLTSLPADCTSKRAAGSVADVLKTRAAEGIETLRQFEGRDVEAAYADALWWHSQCLKKFRYGCVFKEEDHYLSFMDRNSAVHECLPWWVRDGMRELLKRALPPVSDSAIMPAFGPGAVAEKGCKLAYQKWGKVAEFSYDVPLMNLVSAPATDEELVRCARLCCVPKQFDKPRLITVEPLEQSMGQQWTRSLIYRSIHHGVLRGTEMDAEYVRRSVRYPFFGGLETRRNLGDELQGLRALEASATGRLATIDMSDASDSISWANVVETFPPWILAYLERFRSERFSVPGKSESWELRIYAGMGNATTFVVETLYFWALVTVISRRAHAFARVSTYGDDVICDQKAASSVYVRDLLRECGLKLNEAKCGWSPGPGFREACGVVALNGRRLDELIRLYGVPDEGAERKIELASLITRLAHSRSSWHKELASILMDSDDSIAVTNCDIASDCSVASVPWASAERGLVTRWNPRYQRREVKGLVFVPKTSTLRCRNLRPGEALGVLAGALATTTTKGGRTEIESAYHLCRKVANHWVPIYDT